MNPRTRTAALAVMALAVAGCGGGERQDADEPSARFELDVVDASFPGRQSVAEVAEMAIAVRNPGARAVPNVAVTVETRPGTGSGTALAFGQKPSDDSLADGGRPIWIVDRGPRSGDTAYTNTWTLGRLGPGATARFTWRLTPTTAGRYTVDYRVSPDLDATRARLAAGGRTKGSFRVAVSDEPREATIGADGEIVRR